MGEQDPSNPNFFGLRKATPNDYFSFRRNYDACDVKGCFSQEFCYEFTDDCVVETDCEKDNCYTMSLCDNVCINPGINDPYGVKLVTPKNPEHALCAVRESTTCGEGCNLEFIPCTDFENQRCVTMEFCSPEDYDENCYEYIPCGWDDC